MSRILRFIRNKTSGVLFRVRKWYWSRVLGSLGDNSSMTGIIFILHPDRIFIGNNSKINQFCSLNARSQITIGDNVHISSSVTINTGGLDYAKKGENRTHLGAPVEISNGVWIGSGAIINPGVTIGENSVIGAGAVVVKNVPANVVMGGVPAKIIKKINFVE